MSKTINSKKLRLNLKEILKLAEAGMDFDITYHSKKVARLVPYKSSEKDKADSEGLVDFLKNFKPEMKSDIDKRDTKAIYHDLLDEKYKKYLPKNL